MSISLQIIVAEDNEDYRFLFEQSLHEQVLPQPCRLPATGLKVIALLIP